MILQGHEIEFIEDGHIYLCDGVIVPSVTQILKMKFGNKYNRVSEATLNSAAEKGTAVHKAIEDYCKDGTESELEELRNFKFLKKKYDFEVIANEVPILLYDESSNKPICCGRLDLQISKDGKMGLADIKRTATLDKEYLGYQLNIYRLAFIQCYGGSIDFLAGIHLREKTRKYVDIPINEDLIYMYLNEWRVRNDSRRTESDIEGLFR